MARRLTRRLACVLAAAALAVVVKIVRAANGASVRRIVVFGDSQAEGVALALRRAARQCQGLEIQNRTKPGTAISQLSDYDWPAAIKKYAASEHAAVAVMMFGGNDRMPIRAEGGHNLGFRTEAWQAVYSTRVATMVHDLTAAGIRVVWLGQPITRDLIYRSDMEYLNGIYRTVLAAEPAASFVDLWSVIVDAAGGYVSHARSAANRVERVRLDDGIHFTPVGYDVIAIRVMQEIEPAQEAAP